MRVKIFQILKRMKERGRKRTSYNKRSERCEEKDRENVRVCEVYNFEYIYIENEKSKKEPG